MKKPAWFILLLICAPARGEDRAYINLMGGLDFSLLSAEKSDAVDTRPKIGFNVGANAEYQAWELFSFSAGAGLESKGERYLAAPVVNWKEAGIDLLYLQIPLLANLTLGRRTFRLEAGPELGFLLSQSLTVDETDVEAREIKDWNGFDLGATLGLGMEFGFKGRRERLSVKLSASQGLLNGTESPQWTYWSLGSEARNRTVKLVFGMKIPAHKAPVVKKPAGTAPAPKP